MAEIRYAGLHKCVPLQRVTTNGSQYGPPGGDSWSQLEALPFDSMPAGPGRYAVICSGKIADGLIVGQAGDRVAYQVSFGTTAGVRCPHLTASHLALSPLGTSDGAQFLFLVLIDTTFADPVLGSSFTPSDLNEFCLWGRTTMNGDPQTCYGEFTVADLAFLWFDLGEIPGTDWSADVDTTLKTLLAAPPSAWERLSPNNSGTNGQTWLHFGALRYWSPVPHQAPRLAFAVTEDATFGGRVTKVGRTGRWGMNRARAGSITAAFPVEMHHGCMWVSLNTGTARAGWAGYELSGSSALTEFRRWAHFAVRIDTLPDVRWSEWSTVTGSPVPGGTPQSGAWLQDFVTLERPAIDQLTEPILIAQQMVGDTGGYASYAPRCLETSSNRVRFECVVGTNYDPNNGEAMTSMAFGRRPFQVGSPAMQFRLHAVGLNVVIPSTRRLYDSFMVAFHPVRDPNNTSTPPGTGPAAILVDPGRQSPSPAALPVPPFSPNGDPLIRPVTDRQKLTGITGYSRSWPLGSGPLLVVQLTWGPLLLADALTVFRFLRDNRAWRWRSPFGVDEAALTIDQPELAPTDVLRAQVTATIAVLVWTD